MKLQLSSYEETTGPAVFGEIAPAREKYTGPERRRANRRARADRRLEMRYELNSSDRRDSAGRRVDDQTMKFW